MAEEKKPNENEFQFVLFGVVFGVVACITFVLLYPWAQEKFGEDPRKEINIPRDEDPDLENADEEESSAGNEEPSKDSKGAGEEVSDSSGKGQAEAAGENGESTDQEGTGESTGQGTEETAGEHAGEGTDTPPGEGDPSEGQQGEGSGEGIVEPGKTSGQVPQEPTVITQIVELELADYTRLFEKMRSVGKEAAKSMVTVTAGRSGTDWFNALQEKERQVSGLLVGDNGVEKLILTTYSDIEGAEQLSVTFSDYTNASAVLKKYDRVTDLAVLGVNLADMAETTRAQVKMVTWGNSKTVKAGEPVIAIGSPVGISGSMLFGNITAITYDVPVVDGEYQLLLTDMDRSDYSNGALVNFNGEIVGWLQDSYLHSGNRGAMTAYGISGLKSIIEHLCNNQDIVYLGVNGVDMTPEMRTELAFPTGVYIASVEMDSPAMAAGMQSGDIIVDISGQKIGSLADMQELLLNFSAEQLITVKVMRQGKDGLKEIAFDVSLRALK